VVSFTSLPLYPQGKSPWYPLDRRLAAKLCEVDFHTKRNVREKRKQKDVEK
jgi:hypothetical protein